MPLLLSRPPSPPFLSNAREQVTTRTYTSWRPELNPVRWEVAARSPRFARLEKRDMLRLLRDHDCPAGIADHCRGHIIYTRSDFVLTPQLLTRVLADALQLLKVAKKGVRRRPKLV